MQYEEKNGNIYLKEVSCLNIPLSVDCGQAFRWKETDEKTVHGVIKNRAVDIIQNENETVFLNVDKAFFENELISYFDLNRNYEDIILKYDDEHLKKACKEFYGIRILKQDEWEAVCSFIISANNNIPRIKGIIERLCQSFGEKINDEDYTFPSYTVLAKLNEDDLAPLRAGFRNKYILDAARKFDSGEIDVKKINAMPIEEARQQLQKIKGVGAKVAECALLYGFGRIEAFPIDVWVKRIMGELYPNGLPGCIKGNEGIAQQYLFHWRRNSVLTKFEN